MKWKPYENYSESNIPWIGPLPNHWSIKRIKHIANLRSGDAITADQIEESGEFPVYGGNGLRGYTSAYTHNGSHVLIGRQGALCGNVNYASGKFWASEHAVVAAGEYESIWLGELLRIMNLNQYSVTAAQPGLSIETIGNLPIPVPPPEEQTAIAAFLDHETTQIDTLIAEHNKILELINYKIVSFMSQALINDSIEWIRLEHICSPVIRPVLQQPSEEYTPLGLFNRGRGLFHKVPRAMDDMGDSDFYWVEPGDLIFSGQFAWEGAVALAGPEEQGCVVSHRYPVIRGDGTIALTEYLYALFLTGFGDFLLNENSRGAAGRNRPLNLASLLKEKIPIATMKLQKELKESLDAKKPLVEEASRLIALLQEHRSALVTAVVTGKVDVRGAVA